MNESDYYYFDSIFCNEDKDNDNEENYLRFEENEGCGIC
jgi:hypothetical protein